MRHQSGVLFQPRSKEIRSNGNSDNKNNANNGLYYQQVDTTGNIQGPPREKMEKDQSGCCGASCSNAKCLECCATATGECLVACLSAC